MLGAVIKARGVGGPEYLTKEDERDERGCECCAAARGEADPGPAWPPSRRRLGRRAEPFIVQMTKQSRRQPARFFFSLVCL